MGLITWDENHSTLTRTSDPGSAAVLDQLDLTSLHGEREFIRHAFVADFNGDGRLEIITRTLNANRARCMRLDGETLWVSPDILPPPEGSSQTSQIDVGDIDGDGRDEIVLATYQGNVICLSTVDGSLCWQRRLDWHINNPRLDIRKALPGAGRNIALTVGNDFDWIQRHARPRINLVRQPSLILLDGRGDVHMVAHQYAGHNSDGHNTWMFDIDGDGLCEIACSGDNQLIWYRSDGTRLFALPCKGEGSSKYAHPDDLQVCNWDDSQPSQEIIYLDGTDGVIVAGSDGQILHHRLYPESTASHLQNITPLVQPGQRCLLAENIRSRDSKLLCLDADLQVRWAALADTDMVGVQVLDWDGDGQLEIACGSHGRDLFNREGAAACSFFVMKLDGTPLYRHDWPDDTACTPLAVIDYDGDGADEVLVGVGTHGGPEGRFSLAQGSTMKLCWMGCPS